MTDTTPEGEPAEDGGNAEAAKYRVKLKDARAERDVLAAKLEAVQRQQVTQLLEAARVKPDALWLTTDLEALLADDGTVDPAAVAGAIAAARDRLGIAPLSKGTIVPGVGTHPDPKTLEPQQGWASAFGG